MFETVFDHSVIHRLYKKFTVSFPILFRLDEKIFLNSGDFCERSEWATESELKVDFD